MKRRAFAFCAMVLIIAFTLCGCDLLAGNIADLLNTPELSGDAVPIAEAISASAGGEYTFVYPSRGNYRSPVIQNDIDGDGKLEAFAFYSKNDGETAVYMNIISFEGDKWVSKAQEKMIAGGVDRVEFCDLDGDGIQEILVGWEIYGTSEMQLAVYSLKGNKIATGMLQKYTDFVCCDLDENGVKEVMIITLNTAEQTNNATVYEVGNDGPKAIYSCELDKTVKSVNEPVVSTLSSGKAAVYIDEIKGVGAVTEVLFVEKNRLVNPLFNAEIRETAATLRSMSYSVNDINSDGIVEIPIQEAIPAVSGNEKLYLTNWCSFNGETLTNQITTLINTNDGYYYAISGKRLGQIALLKEDDKQLLGIYRYDAESGTVGEMLVTFRTVKKSEWDKGNDEYGGYEEIMHDGISSYICKIGASAVAEGITVNDVRKNFKLFE